MTLRQDLTAHVRPLELVNWQRNDSSDRSCQFSISLSQRLKENETIAQKAQPVGCLLVFRKLSFHQRPGLQFHLTSDPLRSALAFTHTVHWLPSTLGVASGSPLLFPHCRQRISSCFASVRSFVHIPFLRKLQQLRVMIEFCAFSSTEFELKLEFEIKSIKRILREITSLILLTYSNKK